MADANGAATPAEKVANSVTLILLARAFAIIGPAVAAFLLAEVWRDLSELNKSVQALSTKVAVQTVQIQYLEKQLSKFNGTYGRAAQGANEPAAPD